MNNQRKFNKFFYDTQQHRMLGLAYIFLTMEGIIFAVAAVLGFWFGLMSFLYIFAVAGGFAYIYFKKFDKELKDRETIWLIEKIRKYLEIEI